MDFGEAIRALKAGARVAREGWNGKGMWLAHMPSMTVPEGYIVMWTAQGVWQPGWLASQADMLADDWEVVS